MAAAISPHAPASLPVLPEIGDVRFATEISRSQEDHRRSVLTATGKMARIREITARPVPAKQG